MDWSALSCPALGWDLCVGVLSVILINLVLSGDNAVVIAMAVNLLPKEKRFIGLAFGTGLAVALRIVLTIFAAQMLRIVGIKFIGGALIFWIAVKLLIEDVEAKETTKRGATIWHAIWMILVADVTMSTDNVLALAAASKGNLFLLLFGLIMSIPLVVFGSTWLARLMDKYPIIVYLGAALLGKVAAEMIFTDPFVASILKVSDIALYILEAIGAASVVIVARVYLSYKGPKAPTTDNTALSSRKSRYSITRKADNGLRFIEVLLNSRRLTVA
ncbi:MAG TPA: TerC family protein [Desulfomonilaceae bacterium]|nr:TerC family protein [Desulfomonilaceae bacterium]